MTVAWLAFAVGLVLGAAVLRPLGRMGRRAADWLLPARHLVSRGARRRQDPQGTVSR